MMNILPVVFRQICQLLTLNFSKGHTFLEILLPNLLPLWTLVLENMNLFSVQFCKGNNLSWGRCVHPEKINIFCFMHKSVAQKLSLLRPLEN